MPRRGRGASVTPAARSAASAAAASASRSSITRRRSSSCSRRLSPSRCEPVDHDRLPHGRDIGDAVAEEVAHVLLVAPQWCGLCTLGKGRRERLHGLEHLADEALGRPADEGDASTRLRDPHELVGCRMVVRREHHADRREHDVERAVGERQRLGVGLAPLELGAGLGRDAPPDVEQLGREVARDDHGAAQRGRDRSVAAAGGDVEHARRFSRGRP
jgi:hypothetical protein